MDDCAQRCYKTPYKYIEDLQKLGARSSAMGQDDDVDMDTTSTLGPRLDEFNSLLARPEPSSRPFLLTILSQLPHKVGRARAGDRDGLVEIFAFIRKLICKLAGKVEEFDILWACVEMVEDCFNSEELKNGELWKEVGRLRNGLRCIQHPPVREADKAMQGDEESDNGALPDFVHAIIRMSWCIVLYCRFRAKRTSSSGRPPRSPGAGSGNSDVVSQRSPPSFKGSNRTTRRFGAKDV